MDIRDAIDKLRLENINTDAYDKMFLDVLDAEIEQSKNLEKALKTTKEYFTNKFERLQKIIYNTIERK